MDRPELHQLRLLRVGDEKVLIIREVGYCWEELALVLEFDYSVIKFIRHDHYSSVKACQEIFCLWLEGKGCQEVTWRRLIEALKDIERSSLAGKIERLFEFTK